MGATIIEPEPELELLLIRPPDDPSTVHEYQRGITELSASLKALGIEVYTRGRAFDAVHPVGLGVSAAAASSMRERFRRAVSTPAIDSRTCSSLCRQAVREIQARSNHPPLSFSKCRHDSVALWRTNIDVQLVAGLGKQRRPNRSLSASANRELRNVEWQCEQRSHATDQDSSAASERKPRVSSARARYATRQCP